MSGASRVWYAMASLAAGHESISVRSQHLEYEQEERRRASGAHGYGDEVSLRS